MSRTAVIVSDAEDGRALCRLCMIYHEYFVNIFIPNTTFRICAEEAIHDLLSLKVAVRDGLPSNICHQCVNKLIEFRDFKQMCLKTAAELRKYDMDNILRVSKIKDEGAADKETSREGISPENAFPTDIHVTEVYIAMPDKLATGTVSYAKEELWSSENVLVVKEEVNDGGHRIECDVPMNALTSVAVDPLAFDMVVLKEEAQEPKGAAGDGNNFGDTSPRKHVQETEVFAPVPDQLAMGVARHVEENARPTELMVKEEIGEGPDCSKNDIPVVSLSSVSVDPLAVDTTIDIKVDDDIRMGDRSLSIEVRREVCLLENEGSGNECSVGGAPLSETKPENQRYAEEDSRPTELMVKEEIGVGLECSENDMPVISLSSVNVDPLAVDTTVDRCNNTGGLVMNAEYESDKIVSNRQWISQKEVLNNPYFDPVREKNLQPELSMANSFDVNSSPQEMVKNQNNNVEFYAVSKIFSQVNDWATPARNQEREQLCHQAENTCYHTDYICNYCSTRCSEKKSLALHIKRHMVGTKSARVLPNKDFPPSLSQRLLVKDQGHVQPVIQETSNISFSPNNCGGVKPFNCNQCGKMFSCSSQLNRHSVVHSDVKAFKRNDCGKMFNRKNSLKIHSLVHTGVKAFKCNDCGKMFNRKNKLKIHSVVHTGVKAFKCDDCGKMFSRISNLRSHSVIHTGVKPLKCNECGKMFSRIGDLRNHSVVHTGVKAFKCNDCGKMFNRKKNLKTHSVVHTGVKAFKCNDCGKMFSFRVRSKIRYKCSGASEASSRVVRNSLQSAPGAVVTSRVTSPLSLPPCSQRSNNAGINSIKFTVKRIVHSITTV